MAGKKDIGLAQIREVESVNADGKTSTERTYAGPALDLSFETDSKGRAKLAIGVKNTVISETSPAAAARLINDVAWAAFDEFEKQALNRGLTLAHKEA
tara:strand:+ start:1285 stop:1578 length:294 start_codon:yes stop_codon:yes gene_type:complete